jgi:hypothetical protein
VANVMRNNTPKAKEVLRVELTWTSLDGVARAAMVAVISTQVKSSLSLV